MRCSRPANKLMTSGYRSKQETIELPLLKNYIFSLKCWNNTCEKDHGLADHSAVTTEHWVGEEKHESKYRRVITRAPSKRFVAISARALPCWDSKINTEHHVRRPGSFKGNKMKQIDKTHRILHDAERRVGGSKFHAERERKATCDFGIRSRCSSHQAIPILASVHN